jgi:hypothetical protein
MSFLILFPNDEMNLDPDILTFDFRFNSLISTKTSFFVDARLNPQKKWPSLISNIHQ